MNKTIKIFLNAFVWLLVIFLGFTIFFKFASPINYVGIIGIFVCGYIIGDWALYKAQESAKTDSEELTKVEVLTEDERKSILSGM